jgi:predicted P-loop ATPase
MWFSDDITEIGTKDSAIQLLGKWIVELAELDAIRKAEMTTIKAFLVRRIDHFRPPYGRRAEDFPRQNVFAATTNKTDWLQDDTGGRRFWPIKTEEIDVEGLAETRDQLWAEAFFYYGEGELSYLSESVEALAVKEQRDRQESDVWTNDVLDWVKEPVASRKMRSSLNRIYHSDVLEHCLEVPAERRDRAKTSRVTRILKLAGYGPKRESSCDAEKGKAAKEYWAKISE